MNVHRTPNKYLIVNLNEELQVKALIIFENKRESKKNKCFITEAYGQLWEGWSLWATHGHMEYRLY